MKNVWITVMAAIFAAGLCMTVTAQEEAVELVGEEVLTNSEVVNPEQITDGEGAVEDVAGEVVEDVVEDVAGEVVEDVVEDVAGEVVEDVVEEVVEGVVEETEALGSTTVTAQEEAVMDEEIIVNEGTGNTDEIMNSTAESAEEAMDGMNDEIPLE